MEPAPVSTSVRVGASPTSATSKAAAAAAAAVQEAATFATSAVRTDWARRYAGRLALTDTLAVGSTVLVCYLAVFGTSTVPLSSGDGTALRINVAQLSFVIAVIWLLALAAFDTRGKRIVGSGATEYKRVADASGLTFAGFLFLAYVFNFDVSRSFVLLLFPAVLGSIVLSRWLWRKWLLSRRKAGLDSARVVLVGSASSVRLTAAELARTPEAGYRVVGASITDGPETGELAGIPLIGAVADVPSRLDTLTADTVIATGSDDLSPQRIRELSWHLDAGRHSLLVAPSITDIGGSRVHLRPVAGLPLLHVEAPHSDGPQKFAKRVFDVIGSAILLLLLSPLLLFIAVVVRRSSIGPVFYSQERVGLGGTKFRILKFRSMYVDADQRREELLAAAGGRRLFKLANDPRVTPIGRFLRKYSLDELPQLLNVLRGDMSLVGPRPALPSEVCDYDSKERRRLAVTPGMSGLWQVSGRSNLDWEDGLRLDLYYVENWSMTGDLIILWRTARAVFRSEGAY